jgi:hypothetical protein
MTYINWNVDVFVDPATLSPAAGGIPIPTYGNYGGPGYSNGSVGGIITIGAHAPVDSLDALFYAHDLAYQLPFATNFGPANSTMPNSTAGDAAFAQAAANTIFGSASTNNLTNVIDGWVSNWKAFYSNHGVPGISDP